MQFFNTASNKKECFVPLDANHIRLYACGPTVYDHIHLGNARPLVVFDVLYRLLKSRFQRVSYVRNITDIDDKILHRAQTRNISTHELTEMMIVQFHKDCQSLVCLKPDTEPQVTAHIDQICAMIALLLQHHHAYHISDGEGAGHVFFDISTKKNYGHFANRHQLESRLEGARISPLPYKKNAADFVLWKPSSPCEPGWESPWGYGRPGWHIECSAISTHYLGTSFDIHCGGQDLIFPHHQNEIAQSEGAYPESCFARYWLHNGYITCGGEKMSKSLGNFHTVASLLEEYSGETLRLMLLQTHYRRPFDFSHQKLQAAKMWLTRLCNLFAECRDIFSHQENTDDDMQKHSIESAVSAALADDLNSPKALTIASDAMNRLRHEKDKSVKKQLFINLQRDMNLLGLSGKMSGKSDKEGMDTATTQKIESLIAKRDQARKDKNFNQADKIRLELETQGIMIEDRIEGTSWKRQF